MTKVAFVSNENPQDFVNEIKKCCVGRKVVDIKYHPVSFYNAYERGVPTDIKIIDRALIIYEE